MAGAPAQLDHPGLLPSVLVPNEDGSTTRSTRDWIVDTTCFLLALAHRRSPSSPRRTTARRCSDEQFAADAIVGFLCCCALWLRRRYPVGVLAALTLPAAVFTSPSAAALIAFFTVAVHRPFRYVAIFGAISLASVFLYYELHPDPRHAPARLVRDLREHHDRRRGVGDVRARAAPARALAARAGGARRGRAPGARRAGAAAGAGADRARDARRARPPDLAALDAGGRAGVPAGRDAGRGRARGRRDPRERAPGAAGPARGHRRAARGAAAPCPSRRSRRSPTCPRWSTSRARPGWSCATACGSRTLASVPAAMGRNAYRIVQEGLTNARRHAPGDRGRADRVRARPATGSRSRCATRWRVPARSARSRRARAPGIIGLAERAHLAGGKLEHGRTPGGDHRLWAWLPWPA